MRKLDNMADIIEVIGVCRRLQKKLLEKFSTLKAFQKSYSWNIEDFIDTNRFFLDFTARALVNCFDFNLIERDDSIASPLCFDKHETILNSVANKFTFSICSVYSNYMSSSEK